MSNKIVKPLTLAIGAAFLGSAALTQAVKANTMFQIKPLVSGYMLAGAEGKCSEGKCAVAKMDTNHDGMVSLAEAEKAGWNANQFKAMDTNHDGQLSAQELLTGHKFHKSGASVASMEKGKEGSCTSAKGKEGSCSSAKKSKGAEGSCSSGDKGKEGSCGL